MQNGAKYGPNGPLIGKIVLACHLCSVSHAPNVSAIGFLETKHRTDAEIKSKQSIKCIGVISYSKDTIAIVIQ